MGFVAEGVCSKKLKSVILTDSANFDSITAPCGRGSETNRLPYGRGSEAAALFQRAVYFLKERNYDGTSFYQGYSTAALRMPSRKA